MSSTLPAAYSIPCKPRKCSCLWWKGIPPRPQHPAPSSNGYPFPLPFCCLCSLSSQWRWPCPSPAESSMMGHCLLKLPPSLPQFLARGCRDLVVVFGHLKATVLLGQRAASVCGGTQSSRLLWAEKGLAMAKCCRDL